MSIDRPASDATAIRGGHGLLLYARSWNEMTVPSHYLVKQSEHGAPVWTLELQAPRPGHLQLRTFGSSGLVSFGDRRD